MRNADGGVRAKRIGGERTGLMARRNGIEKLRNVMEHWHAGSLVDWCRGVAYRIEREHQDELNERIEAICELDREIAQLRAELAAAKRDMTEAAERADMAAATLNDVSEMVFGEVRGPEHAGELLVELGKRLMPNGMNWPPKDGDGEDLHIGDKAHFLRTEYDGDHEWDDVITAFRHQGIEGEGDIWIVEGEHGEAFACECMVKRPEPEVLGADGLPIKVGEAVYSLQGEGPLIVSGYDGEFLKIESGGLLRADYATHTPPDTQGRIDEEAKLEPCEYSCTRNLCAHGEDCHGDWEAEARTAMIADLLRRQREMDAKTMGGDAL